MNLIDQYTTIVASTGEDIHQHDLAETPKRAAEAFAFMTKGYKQSLARIANNALFESTSDDMVIVRNIELYSLCRHHLLPFIGTCHVGYLPDGKVIGLSKIARIVDMFARRLQVQEALTSQIAAAILSVTKAQGVGVIIQAKHLCMMMRGVEKQNSEMVTSAMLGGFRENINTRQEFLTLIKGYSLD